MFSTYLMKNLCVLVFVKQEQKYLKEYEVMVLMGSFLTTGLYDRTKVQALPLKQLNIRAVHIYTTLTETFNKVSATFAVCGFPNPATKVNF